MRGAPHCSPLPYFCRGSWKHREPLLLKYDTFLVGIIQFLLPAEETVQVGLDRILDISISFYSKIKHVYLATSAIRSSVMVGLIFTETSEYF